MYFLSAAIGPGDDGLGVAGLELEFQLVEESDTDICFEGGESLGGDFDVHFWREGERERVELS